MTNFHPLEIVCRGSESQLQVGGNKGKGKDAGLQSDYKSEDIRFICYPLVTGSAHSCAISTPQKAYSPAAILAY